MRNIKTEEITAAVAQLCKDAAYYLPDDVYEALKKGRATEKSPVGCDVLDQIIKNAEIAKAEDRPYCQDTGLTIVFVEIGQEVHIEGGLLEDAINAGIAKGYTEGYLRKSVVAEPLFNRVNTKDNTPGVIYTQLVAGDKLKITIAPKGFGSENKSGLEMLVPADGVEGVKAAVMRIIKHADCNPCPPMVVGVGIGGTMDKAAYMSKKALLHHAGRPCRVGSHAHRRPAGRRYHLLPRVPPRFADVVILGGGRYHGRKNPHPDAADGGNVPQIKSRRQCADFRHHL